MPPLSRPNNSWAVLNEDCRQVINYIIQGKKTWGDRWRHPELIFADPPFNIGQEYVGYSDCLEDYEYNKFTHGWFVLAARALSPNGILCVHVPDKIAKSILLLAETPDIKREITQIEWVIWHYRFGQCGRGKLINSKCHLLVYAKDPNKYTWNPDSILVASDRAEVYGDSRTEDSQTPGMRVPFDVWGIPSDGQYWGRVQGNNKERRGNRPNQLPEVYMERIVKAWTNKGDLVADIFCGTGTLGAVSVALGRRYLGIDVDEDATETTIKRIKEGPVRL